MQTPPPGHRTDVDLEALNRDLEGLVASARTDFANNPFDAVSQQRLKALLDLQSILQRQQLTQDQLKLVRGQVSALAASSPASAAQNPAPNAPAPAPAAAPLAAPPVPVSTPPTQSASQPLQQLLNPGTLAELIKATAARQQPTPPPQIPSALPPMPQIPQASNTMQPAAENPLIAALRSRGLLPPASAPPSLASGTPPNAGTLPFIMPGQARATPPAATPQASVPASSVVPMNTASMKM